MRVLLRSDISGVGKKGDIVEVAKGFARNYLFPTGSALIATGGVEAQAAAMRKARALRDAQDKESAQAVAGVLSAAVVKITARAGTEGRLFGSVTTHDVAEAIQAARPAPSSTVARSSSPSRSSRWAPTSSRSSCTPRSTSS